MRDFGSLQDEDFIRGRVPMTKREIRILTLSQAGITENSVIVDIGAGTGSLSVTAALAAPNGQVYAWERSAEGQMLVRRNAAKFGVTNLRLLAMEAPQGMEGLPVCDAVLIGGSGGRLKDVLEAADDHLKPGGRIVINCITVQTLSAGLEYMRAQGGRYRYDAVQVQVNRLVPAGPYDMLKAANPVYILTGIKQSEE